MGKRARKEQEKKPKQLDPVEAAIKELKECLGVSQIIPVGAYAEGTMIAPAVVDLLVVTPTKLDTLAKLCGGQILGNDRISIKHADFDLQLFVSEDEARVKASSALAKQIQSHPALPDAIKMAKLWCRQRLQCHPHGLSGYQVTRLHAQMLADGHIDPLMSEMQVFRAFLQRLAKGDLVLDGVLKGCLKQAALDAKLALSQDLEESINRLLTVPDLPMAKFDLVLTTVGMAGEMPAMVALLERGLGQRIHHLMPLADGALGVALNPSHCFSLLEMGPPTSAPAECAQFKQLWGSKAQTRRFRDGSIRECAVWEDLAEERHLIVPTMAAHLLAKHFAGCKVEHQAGLFDGLLPRGSFSPAMESFEELGRLLRGLEMPLRISQCVAVGAGLRFASLHPPALLDGHPPLPRHLQPANHRSEAMAFLIGFEGSSRWPTDPHALSLAKQAFAVRIAKLLKQEHGIPSSPRRDGCLEIFHQGHLLHGYIHCEREADLLRSHGLPSHQAHYALHHIQPVLWRQLHTLHTRCILYGPSVRLAKRWTASQLLDLDDMAIELLVAHLFLPPFTPPASLEAAFIRFLQLVADPPAYIRVVFGDDDAMGKGRESANKQGLLIVTSLKELPSLNIPGHLLTEWQAQAKAALKAMPKILTDHTLVELLFTRSPDRYDAALKLKSLFKLSNQQSRFIQAAAGDALFQRSLPSLDPVGRLVADLRLAHGKQATIHYDPYGGDFVGIRCQDPAVISAIRQFSANFIDE